ncbi:Uncharacterized protein OBRU01_27040 [Operophtera brumata]|uniref:Essential protein Yae1 N-terminal domain-containing protein n=1 Tax=Operophtera brumata TaxID=104452 RepID=A0A0L7K1W2_OPEBR|nr:Uncharacterized protein OBRU01_27040 [Operophtera brumata]
MEEFFFQGENILCQMVFSDNHRPIIQRNTNIGFMDGASDGQKAVFQSSFDLGYKQGLDFGFELGLKKAMSLQQVSNIERHIRDTRKINCQVCLNILTLQQNVGNMHNIQQEKNNELLMASSE